MKYSFELGTASASEVVKRSLPSRKLLATMRVQSRLVDRQLAVLQALHLGRIVVDAGDGVAHFGKARAGHQPDVTGPDNADIHVSAPASWPIR